MAARTENISNKTYEAIGRFIFEFSQLEYEIRYRVAEEAWVMDEYFNAIMVHDFNVLCTAAEHVFEIGFEKDPPQKLKDFKTLIKKARELSNIRNAVAHGLWVPFMEGGKVIHVPRSLKPNISTEQADALNKKADEARQLRAQIAAMAGNRPIEGAPEALAVAISRAAKYQPSVGVGNWATDLSVRRMRTSGMTVSAYAKTVFRTVFANRDVWRFGYEGLRSYAKEVDEKRTSQLSS